VIGAEKKFFDVNHKLKDTIFAVVSAWLTLAAKAKIPMGILR